MISPQGAIHQRKERLRALRRLIERQIDDRLGQPQFPQANGLLCAALTISSEEAHALEPTLDEFLNQYRRAGWDCKLLMSKIDSQASYFTFKFNEPETTS